MGLVVGFVFYQLDGSPQGIYARISSFYISLALYTYINVMYLTYRLSEEINVFRREKKDSLYGPVSFLFSQIISMSPFVILFNAIFVSMTYFMSGFRMPATHFGGFLGMQMLLQLDSMVISWFCVSFSNNYAQAVTATNPIFAFFNYTAGFLIKTSTLPVYVRWIS